MEATCIASDYWTLVLSVDDKRSDVYLNNVWHFLRAKSGSYHNENNIIIMTQKPSKVLNPQKILALCRIKTEAYGKVKSV